MSSLPPSRKKGLAVTSGILGVAGLVGAAYCVGSLNYRPLAYPHTTLDGVSLGELDSKGVAFQVGEWASKRNRQTIQWEVPKGFAEIEPATAAELGLTVDVEKTVAPIRYMDFPTYLAVRARLKQVEGGEIKPQFRADPALVAQLADKVDDDIPDPRPAKARWVGETVSRTYEMGRAQLDREALPAALEKAALSGGHAVLPAKMGAKKITDSQLDQVKTVIGRFATNFNSPASRANNIKVASMALDGYVLAPGQTFSFNGFLGKRTKDKGFQTAGVFKNGKHDRETGGGICQVSTTLYNAVLQAGLEVVTRQNHSMPVWYVPAGQDATVSYPDLDFAFRNNRKEPIAISTFYKPGRLEFVLLGAERLPGEVHVENHLLRSWGVPKTIKQYNPSLKPGTTRVVSKGSTGREVASYRVVKLDGKEKRESLGVSHYSGGVRVVEFGPKAPAVPAGTPMPVLQGG